MKRELALHFISTRHLDGMAALLAADGPMPWSGAERRIYFGSEFCTHLLPPRSDLEAALVFAHEHALPLTLVTPYGGDELIDRMQRLLPVLPEGSEVVANDWGTLRLVSRTDGVTPVMGRMLSKLMRDPWVHHEWSMAPESRGETVQLPQLLMESLGVQRAETDVLPGGAVPAIDTAGRDLSVYLPWSPLGSGRVCFAGSFGRGRSPRFGVMDECSRPCRQVHIRLDRTSEAYAAAATNGREPAGDVSFDDSTRASGTAARDVSETYLAGNTMLYRHPEEAVARAVDGLPDTVTRLVWEPWIPA